MKCTLKYANVRWNGKNSHQFQISNGVKQGAVLSAMLYCIYMNGLFEKLRENKTGCWINGDFVGILGYAGDNFLLSPTIDELQEMMNTCADYAFEHNLTFSTNENPKKSKTKCIAFLHKKRSISGHIPSRTHTITDTYHHGHLPDGHLPDGHLPSRTLTITDTYHHGHLPSRIITDTYHHGHLPSRTLTITDIYHHRYEI